MVSLVAGVGIFLVWLKGIPGPDLILGLVWVVFLLAVTGRYWKTGKIKEWVVSLPSGIGLVAYIQIQNQFFASNAWMVVGAVLGGIVLSGAVFTTVFGHWYLISSKFPIVHLRQSTRVFFAVLFLRLVWDVAIIWQWQVPFEGEPIGLFIFFLKLDGIFLWVGLLFGILFPLGVLFMVWGTLKEGSTTSATGLLYVILISVLIGDLVFKFYLFRYQIPL